MENDTQNDRCGKLLKDDMLNYLANSKSAHFKSQQLGEPDLSFCEKREIAEEILRRNPALFLQRFGVHLEFYHLDYFVFQEMKDNYEIQYHLKNLREHFCKASKQLVLKNRRYSAMKQLIKEGSYFSEDQMKKRNPLLYDQLIGKYLTEDELKDKQRARMKDATLLSVMLAQIDKKEEDDLREKQLADEEGAMEEVDTSDESEKEDEEEDESEITKEISAKKKELMREEFLSSMYCSFLEGRDVDFDYSQVDENPAYENLAIQEQDAEEKYFDSGWSDEERMNGDDDEEAEEGTREQQDQEDEAVEAVIKNNDEEDELDLFMKNLKPDITPSDLANDLEHI